MRALRCAVVASFLSATAIVSAQPVTVLATGLEHPMKLTLTRRGNLLGPSVGAAPLGRDQHDVQADPRVGPPGGTPIGSWREVLCFLRDSGSEWLFQSENKGLPPKIVKTGWLAAIEKGPVGGLSLLFLH